MATPTPIVWYNHDGNAMSLTPAIDEFVRGENAYSMSHIELQPTTWEACTAYFDTKLTSTRGVEQIEKENIFWIWVFPTKVEGGEASLVATTSVEKLHVPKPIERGKGSTLPAYGAPPTLFNPDRHVVDPTLKGSTLPMETGATVVKRSADTVVDGFVSYWKGNGKDMDSDLYG